jgi:hypothetical protein
MVRISCRAVVLVLVIVAVEAVARLRLKVEVFGLGIKDMPELVEVVIKDNLGAYIEILHGCSV